MLTYGLIYFIFEIMLTQGRIQGGGGGGAPGAHPTPPPPLKLEKNMIFWRKIVIFHTKYLKNYRASLGNWKTWFFGVNRDFFTRNTPTIFAPPSARRNFFKCAPPPPPLTWNPGSAPAYVWSNLLYIWNHAYVWSNLLYIWHHAYVWCNGYFDKKFGKFERIFSLIPSFQELIE